MIKYNIPTIKSIELTIYLSDSRTAVVNKNESIVKLSEGIFTFEESQEIMRISKKFFDFIDRDEFTHDERQTLLVMMDICKRTSNCEACGNKEHCDSIWDKLTCTETQLIISGMI